MKDSTGDRETQMEADILARIQEMENPQYRFPKRFGRRDYILAAVTAIVCLAAIIAGYYL